MRIVLVYQAVEITLKPLTESLEQAGYTLLPFQQADEIDQLGKQVGKVAVLFGNHRLAFKFLEENSFEKLDIFHALYLPKAPVITTEVQSKLNRLHLNVYSPATKTTLLQDFSDFYEGNKTDPAEDLQFAVLLDLEKEE